MPLAEGFGEAEPPQYNSHNGACSMRLLGIDYGQERTGLAVGSASGTLAFPHSTLAMRGKDIFFAELLSVVEKENVQGFVVGLPLRSSGEDSETTRQVRNMVGRLSRRSPLPIFLIEEAHSSLEAESRLRELGKDPRKFKHLLDQAAAVIILESFLSLPPDKRIPYEPNTPNT